MARTALVLKPLAEAGRGWVCIFSYAPPRMQISIPRLTAVGGTGRRLGSQ